MKIYFCGDVRVYFWGGVRVLGIWNIFKNFVLILMWLILENIYFMFVKYLVCFFKNYSVVLLCKFVVVVMKRNYWLKYVDFINFSYCVYWDYNSLLFFNFYVEFG